VTPSGVTAVGGAPTGPTPGGTHPGLLTGTAGALTAALGAGSEAVLPGATKPEEGDEGESVEEGVGMHDTNDAAVAAAVRSSQTPAAAGTTPTSEGTRPSSGAASKAPKRPSAAGKNPKRRQSAAGKQLTTSAAGVTPTAVGDKPTAVFKAHLGTRGLASASCFCESHHSGQGSAQ